MLSELGNSSSQQKNPASESIILLFSGALKIFMKFALHQKTELCSATIRLFQVHPFSFIFHELFNEPFHLSVR
jgi:hypothetical protein